MSKVCTTSFNNGKIDLLHGVRIVSTCFVTWYELHDFLSADLVERTNSSQSISSVRLFCNKISLQMLSGTLTDGTDRSMFYDSQTYF